MDYPFFIAKLFTCTAAELAVLQKLVDTPHPRSSFFITQKQVSSLHHNPNALPTTLVERLATFGFKYDSIRKVGSNVIDPGGKIHDHSDIEAGRDVAVNRSCAHTIHIPVLNNVGIYRHRRSRKQGWASTALELGGVYAYNNYVSHEVDCAGSIVGRINLLIDYVDEDWTQKYNLLSMLNLANPGQRYESDNLYPDYDKIRKQLTNTTST